MGYHLKKTVFSWRFLALFIVQVAMYYYLNNFNNLFTSRYPYTNFYDTFLNLNASVPLLALMCAGLVGLQTHDELDKNYQPFLFSRASLERWVKNKFLANALAGGIFILLGRVVMLLLCIRVSFPPRLDSLFNFQSNPYISIVSENPAVAIMQMLGLDLVRFFIFGVLLSAVATLGAALFRVRYLALAFPALATIIFEHYMTAYDLRSMSWQLNYTLFNLAGRFMKPWNPFTYLGLSALLLFCLANYFVLRRVRHE